MKISSLSAGQRIFSVERRQMGNTMMRTTSVYTVTIVSVAEDGKSFKASWDGNAARTYYRVPSTWKIKKPVLVCGGLTSRVAHRDEIKAGTLVEGPQYFKLIKA